MIKLSEINYAQLGYNFLGFFLYFLIWYFLLSNFGSELFSLEFTREVLFWHIWTSCGFAASFSLFFKSRSKRLISMMFVFYLIFPYFGAAFGGAIMASFLFQKKMNLLLDFHEEDKALSKSNKIDHVMSYEASIQENINVEPLVETIRGHSTTDLKRGAIETLTQISNPQAIALLKECISDPNTEVRFYASSGLSRIEERLNGEIIKYKNKIKKQAHPSADDKFELGKAYYEFVYLEIQDEASLEYYFTESIKAFEEVVEMAPDNIKAREALERAYTKSGKKEKARKLKEKFNKESENLIYRAENYFHDGQFSKCKEMIRQLSDDAHKWETIRDVEDLWLDDKEEI